jgi:putative Ca2+/H+ antiporter (TMEM165/GDT1 family)
MSLQALLHSPFTVSFGIIFVAELVDKTLLVTLLLATRYKALPVLLGAWLGFLLQTLVAVAAGALLGKLPHGLLRWASVAAFAFFGVWMLFTEERIDDEGERKSRGPFVVALLSILMAEWGDATQVGTMALAARLHAPVRVFCGALLGLWAGAVVAVLLGRSLGRMVNPRWLRRAGGVVFLGLAVAASLWRY